MLLRFPSTLWRHRELWWRLTEREVLGRYRGSVLGLSWSFLHPLAMLAVYTFIFSQVFKTRWVSTSMPEEPLGFAANLFAGLIVFNIFAECANKAPTTVLACSHYVKKVMREVDPRRDGDRGDREASNASLHGRQDVVSPLHNHHQRFVDQKKLNMLDFFD